MRRRMWKLMPTHKTYVRIYAVIRRIPRGRVATYGQIASLADASGPRQVGYALAATPKGMSLPWHRVINSKGEISRRADPGDEPLQQGLLEAEGVKFDAKGRIKLRVYRWTPR
jgi:methylated-DNA-protein-cysteine methyltransferase related protein